MIKYRVKELNGKFIIEEGWEERVYWLWIFPTFKKKMRWQEYCKKVCVPSILAMICFSFPVRKFYNIDDALDEVNKMNNPKINEPKYHYPTTI